MSPVIINEFELVPATAENAGQSSTGETEAAAAAATTPARSPVQEAEQLARRHSERTLRTWAH